MGARRLLPQLLEQAMAVTLSPAPLGFILPRSLNVLNAKVSVSGGVENYPTAP